MPRTAVLAVLAALVVPANAAAADRVSVADPSGGARWTAEVTSAAGGRTCAVIRRGRLAKGRHCARLSVRSVYLYTVRTERPSTPRRAKTIAVVLFARSVVRARLATPDGARRYRRRSGRPPVLLAVMAGRVERPPLRAEVLDGGRQTVLNSGAEPAVQVADPQGGAAWRSSSGVGSGSGGDTCVTWERVPPRFAQTPTPARGRPQCGSASDDLPVAAAQVVGRRLVVFGLAGTRVRSVVLQGPDGDEPVALEPSTRALLAVLPGDTDPETLRLVARLGDGSEVVKPLEVVG